MLEVEEYGDIVLDECRNCGRRFRTDVLQKHTPICLKSSKKKRKVFDSGKQRADGSDVPINKTIKPGQIPKPDPKMKQAENMTKQWRQRHEALVESLRAARQYTKAKESGGPLPPPPPATIDPSLVQCPYCQRRFNENASARHIPFCKEQQARVNPKAAAAANKKPLFKAPLPKSRPQPSSNGPPSKPSSYGSQSRTGAPPSRSNQIPKSSASRVQRATPPTSNSSAMRTIFEKIFPRILDKNKSSSGSRIGSVSGAGIPRSNGAASGAQRTRPVPPVSSTRNTGIPSASKTRPTNSSNTATFCHECGSQYSLTSAKFCSECGVRRIAI